MARKTGTVNHIHQYFQRDDGLWACSGMEGCTHFMPKNMSPSPLGLKTICWGGCGRAFKLTPVNMENDHPLCDVCSENASLIEDYTERRLAEASKHNKGLSQFRKPRIVEKDEIEVIEEDE